MFINWSFVQKHQLETIPLPQPVLMYNVDGSANENRSVMEEVHITFHFRCCRQGSESTCTTSPKPNTAQKPWNKTTREAESCVAGPPNDQTRTMKTDF